MRAVSTGRQFMAGIEDNLNAAGLGEVIVKEVYFPRAGEEVEVVLPGDYAVSTPSPSGDYRARVVKGNRRAVIRKGPTSWTWETAYFVSNIADVFVDIAVGF